MSHAASELEVIATSVADGLAAQSGGADRLEVVSAMERDGLLPDLDLVRRLRDAVAIPIRVMLRSREGFGTNPRELASLCRMATSMRAAGIDQFVFGFVTDERQLDQHALVTLCEAAQPSAWTLHRAFDVVADAKQTFVQCQTLPGLDRILTAASPHGIEVGLPTLCRRAAWQTGRLRWIAGGGLRREHVPLLKAAGIRQFHTGRAVRAGGRWDAPVDEALVRRFKETMA